MWNLIAKGAKGIGSYAAKHPYLTTAQLGADAASVWGGPQADDEEEFHKAMEKLHSEGLMMNEDGSGGPIDPKEMHDYWTQHSWHSQHKGQYWGTKTLSAATGFVPYAGLVLPFAIDYLGDKMVDNNAMINHIRNTALAYKNKTLDEQVANTEQPIENEENG